MNKTAVHAIIMVLTTILAKVLGFCRELSLAFSYGASNVSDAYVVAFTLPTILFSGLGTAMLTSYISVYTDLQQNHPGEEKPFHDQVITMSFLLSVAFIAVFMALRYPIVRLFALGFTDFRVRRFGGAARIQRPAAQLERLLAQRENILTTLKQWYPAVLLDLEVRK